MQYTHLAVIYDDRDARNKGWYARAFDNEGADYETTLGMPTRKGAYRAAIKAARQVFGLGRTKVETRVYLTWRRDEPNFVL